MEGPQASVPVAVDNLHQQENKLDFPTFLQMCLPGADKIFDFLPLSTFLSLRQLSQQMKETVDSSYRFYRHLKSHVVWMRTQEELASMRDKLQELVKRNEYSLVDSIQFGLELNESTVYNYVKLTTGLLVKKISHLRISKSINEDFDVTGDEELILRENIKWLSELETFLRKSNLIYTLRSLEVDELAFNNSQKFHKFLMNISNAKKSSNQSVPEENEDPCHPLAIKIGSLKNTNEYSSYLSASGQKGTFMNAFQTQERIKSVINSNLRISLTLRQLADFANEDTNSSERLKFLSSVENIVDLQSFPSTQQMEMIPLVALENCKFDNVYGLIVVLPKPSTEPKNRPKLSPFFEHLYFAKGAWPQLGKKIKQLTIQSSESLHGDSSISRVREDDSLLPVIKLHAEGIRKSFPNLKRIQIWASLSINEWNAWWIAIKPLRNLWSLCLKPSGPVLLDEVFLPSTGYKVPPFLSIPRKILSILKLNLSSMLNLLIIVQTGIFCILQPSIVSKFMRQVGQEWMAAFPSRTRYLSKYSVA